MSAYDVAKSRKDALATATNEASKKLRSLSGGGTMGLTPDSVKASPEWKSAKRAYEVAADEERRFTTSFLKQFKKEYAAERASRVRTI